MKIIKTKELSNKGELPEQKIYDLLKEGDDISKINLKKKEKIYLGQLIINKNIILEQRKILNKNPLDSTLPKKLLKIKKNKLNLEEVRLLLGKKITENLLKRGILYKKKGQPRKVKEKKERTSQEEGKEYAFGEKKNLACLLNEEKENIRKIFLEFGFEEVKGEIITNCFDNMDFLFIPNSHPARSMQDTFYLKKKFKKEIEPAILKKVKKIQEKGRPIKSTGWGESWSKKEAKKLILRTHSTNDSMKALKKEKGNKNRKIFLIEKIFRKEAIDKTHLPEFHQIEGAIVDKNANVKNMIIFWKKFYDRLGFKKIEIKNTFFPYTEPSFEIYGEFNGEMVELGGGGIFRKEIRYLLGTDKPVIGFGLGLERLVMLKRGVSDLRDLIG